MAADERRALVDTLKAPIIQMGTGMGFDVTENYDLGAGSIDVVWTFKPGSESLPDMRLGFVCLPLLPQQGSNYGSSEAAFQSSINEAVARAMLNLIDKLVIVVPSESMTKMVKDSIEGMPDKSILQLRKYVTVLTPSTLVPKAGVVKERSNKEEKEEDIRTASAEVV